VPALPDRVTVLTCLGCGGMGRQERCDACTEHRLPLVGDVAYRALLEVARGSDERGARLATAVRAFAESDLDLAGLRRRARAALRAEPAPAPLDEPDVVVGWWCDRCGNVDLPQPCIGVCVWRPVEWVHHARYEQARAPLDAERELRRFLSLAAAAAPRAGREARHREALRARARAVLSAEASRSGADRGCTAGRGTAAGCSTCAPGG
jgi:hypothetical protein